MSSEWTCVVVSIIIQQGKLCAPNQTFLRELGRARESGDENVLPSTPGQGREAWKGKTTRSPLPPHTYIAGMLLASLLETGTDSTVMVCIRFSVLVLSRTGAS